MAEINRGRLQHLMEYFNRELNFSKGGTTTFTKFDVGDAAISGSVITGCNAVSSSFIDVQSFGGAPSFYGNLLMSLFLLILAPTCRIQSD